MHPRTADAATRLVVPVLDFSRSGGMRVLTEIANRFADRGLRATIVVPRHSDPPYFPVSSEIMYVDFRGRPTRRSSEDRSGVRRLVPAAVGLTIAVRRLVRPGDIVIANHWTTAYPVVAARRGARKIYYIQAYEADRFNRRGSLRDRLMRRLALGSYKLPLTQLVNAPLFLDYPGLHADGWIPPGIDLNVFFPKANIGVPPSAPIVVGCIGRLEPYKGTMDAIDAFRILRARDINVTMSIAFGTHEMVERAGSGACTVQPHGDSHLASYYRSLDVLIAAGTVELGACHYPVIEAMASGTAVVTTGYLPASHDNAWIVPPACADDIAEAISSMSAHPDKFRQKVLAARHAIERFDWNVVIDEFDDFFSGYGRRP